MFQFKLCDTHEFLDLMGPKSFSHCNRNKYCYDNSQSKCYTSNFEQTVHRKWGGLCIRSIGGLHPPYFMERL